MQVVEFFYKNINYLAPSISLDNADRFTENGVDIVSYSLASMHQKMQFEDLMFLESTMKQDKTVV